VRPLRRARAGIVVTGSEVFNGLIQDRFAPILAEKVTALGSEVAGVSFAPDDADLIRQAIVAHLANGCDLILLSGGMSVDPDDVTRQAIQQAGAGEMHYGASALPGAMFLAAWIGDVPLLGYRPAGCIIAPRSSTWCCRGSWPASGSLRKNSPSSATAACARIAPSASSRTAHSGKGLIRCRHGLGRPRLSEKTTCGEMFSFLNPNIRQRIELATNADSSMCWNCSSCDAECPVEIATNRLRPSGSCVSPF